MPLHRLKLPPRWAEFRTAEGNVARQLIAPAGEGSVRETDLGEWRATVSDGTDVAIRERGRTPELADGLELSREAFVALPAVPAGHEPRWVTRRGPGDPSDVLAALEGTFTLRTARGAEPGMRIPQSGAIHAVLAHWSTESVVPATVVLPTGSGKTDTMIALFASERPRCLLVLVPTDNLRKQIADSFETFGVLSDVGVLQPVLPGPVIGRILHRFTASADARAFANRCNVIVTTPGALPAQESVFRALASRCTHLFVDEAHHLAAQTWGRVREAFAGKPVVQFTATPYRTDGIPIGGRIIYSFPLGLAQRLGYFEKIAYISIVSFAAADRAVAEEAVAQLQRDRAAGLDHLVMARVRTVTRADEVLEIYRDVAGNYGPCALHSGLNAGERKAALGALRSRDSRIVVCVDMLGEGFDFPELKIAALHDPHRSLGVALQFIGRFARERSDLGTATAVVARPDPGYDERLRALYAEGNEWDEVIEEIATRAVEEVQELDAFESAFGRRPEDELSIHALRPRMSTVAYETSCDEWQPSNLRRLFDAEDILAGPAVNDVDHVVWMVVRKNSPLRWAHIDALQDTAFHLYVLHWDRDRSLLYINSSDLEGVYEELAQVVCGRDAERVTNERVFRVLGGLQRPVPTTVGVVDLRSTARRFSMHVGSDVYEGFPVAEQQSKANTNVSVVAYDKGERVTMSAARKGRIWSHQAARSVFQWLQWVRAVGPKLQDETLNLDAILRSFVRPKPLIERPPLVPLAIDWPWFPLSGISETVELRMGDSQVHIIDVDLALKEHVAEGPIRFDVRAGEMALGYEADVEDERLVHRPVAEEASVVRERKPTEPLSEYLNREGTTIWFEKEVVVEGPGVRFDLQRELPPIDLDHLVPLDWTGVDLRRESQGPERDRDTVQGRAAEHLVVQEDWDVVVDDDGTGEVADLVALKDRGDYLLVHLVHCKFSADVTPGARLGDLYEVCGQAQRSAHYRQSAEPMVRNLIRRERARQSTGPSRIIVGDAARLLGLDDVVRQRRVIFRITVAQPGLSKNAVRERHLELLAATDVYVSEIAYGSFDVWCST